MGARVFLPFKLKFLATKSVANLLAARSSGDSKPLSVSVGGAAVLPLASASILIVQAKLSQEFMETVDVTLEFPFIHPTISRVA
jgi:hypothetical protein